MSLNPLIILLCYGVIVTLGAGGIMMLWVFRRVIKEEIRAWKLRTMYRPESIRGKKRIHQIK
jgi:hypothetical protein